MCPSTFKIVLIKGGEELFIWGRWIWLNTAANCPLVWLAHCSLKGNFFLDGQVYHKANTFAQDQNSVVFFASAYHGLFGHSETWYTVVWLACTGVCFQMASKVSRHLTIWSSDSWSLSATEESWVGGLLWTTLNSCVSSSPVSYSTFTASLIAWCSVSGLPCSSNWWWIGESKPVRNCCSNIADV